MLLEFLLILTIIIILFLTYNKNWSIPDFNIPKINLAIRNRDGNSNP